MTVDETVGRSMAAFPCLKTIQDTLTIPIRLISTTALQFHFDTELSMGYSANPLLGCMSDNGTLTSAALLGITFSFFL